MTLGDVGVPEGHFLQVKPKHLGRTCKTAGSVTSRGGVHVRNLLSPHQLGLGGKEIHLANTGAAISQEGGSPMLGQDLGLEAGDVGLLHGRGPESPQSRGVLEQGRLREELVLGGE